MRTRHCDGQEKPRGSNAGHWETGKASRFPLSAPALGLLALGILLTFLLASPLLEALETGLIQF